MTAATSDMLELKHRPIQFAAVIYRGFTLLDLARPRAALGLHGQTHLLSKTMDPVPADTGISLNPTTTLADVPRDIDVMLRQGIAAAKAHVAAPI